jgi:hypothetical protein
MATGWIDEYTTMPMNLFGNLPIEWWSDYKPKFVVSKTLKNGERVWFKKVMKREKHYMFSLVSRCLAEYISMPEYQLMNLGK